SLALRVSGLLRRRQNPQKTLPLQRRPSDQSPIDIRLGKQSLGVVGGDATAVLNPDAVGNCRIVPAREQFAKVGMDLLRLLGRGDDASSNGPNRLVSDHNLA